MTETKMQLEDCESRLDACLPRPCGYGDLGCANLDGSGQGWMIYVFALSLTYPEKSSNLLNASVFRLKKHNGSTKTSFGRWIRLSRPCP